MPEKKTGSHSVDKKNPGNRNTGSPNHRNTGTSDMMAKTSYLEMVNSRIEKTTVCQVGVKLTAFLFCCFIMSYLNQYMLIGAICLTVLALAADATLKRHELIYRKLYNDIRFGNHKVDFDLYPVYTPEEVPTWWGSFAKATVWVFYLVLIVVYAVMLILMKLAT